MTDKEITAEIYKRLQGVYTGREWCAIKECRIGTGYENLNTRSIDFFAICTNAGNLTTAFEVKASLSDFKKDIADPEKQKAARTFANFFYYIAPKDMIPIELLPCWAGLMEVDMDVGPTKYPGFDYCTLAQAGIKKRIKAPQTINNPPTWGFVAEIIRNLQKVDK